MTRLFAIAAVLFLQGCDDKVERPEDSEVVIPIDESPIVECGVDTGMECK